MLHRPDPDMKCELCAAKHARTQRTWKLGVKSAIGYLYLCIPCGGYLRSLRESTQITKRHHHETLLNQISERRKACVSPATRSA